MAFLEWIGNLKASVYNCIGENHKTIAYTAGGLFITVKLAPVIKGKVDQWRIQRAMKKWEDYSPNVVVLHTLPRGPTVPNLSPFAMKLETFLRLGKIPYEIDFELPWGPVGKTPWITINGQHFYDSQRIIDLLTKRYNISIGNYSEEELAIAKAVRVMCDEYLYWGIGLWRYSYSEGKGLNEIFNMSPFALKLFYKTVNKRMLQSAWNQGIGRHPKEEVIAMMNDVLKTASLILGNKKFLLGDVPCEGDCSLFGFLSMVMWAAPGSPYESYLNENLPNLKEYCIRMKTTAWEDWDDCLASPKDQK